MLLSTDDNYIPTTIVSLLSSSWDAASDGIVPDMLMIVLLCCTYKSDKSKQRMGGCGFCESWAGAVSVEMS